MPPTKTNIRHAERMRDGILADIARGTFDYARWFPDSARAAQFGPSTIGDDKTIAAALSAWLGVQQASAARSTKYVYNTAVNRHLIPAFGRLRMTELTAQMIKTWRAERLEEGFAPRSINTWLSPLRGLYSDAVADEWIDRNPFDRVRSLPDRVQDPDPFTRDEVDRILAAMPDGATRDLFTFAFWSGLRTGEVLGLNWGDVDFERGAVFVRATYTRGERKPPKTATGRRTVPMLGEARAALRRRQSSTAAIAPRADWPVFTNPVGARWHASTLRRKVWRPATERAKVPYRPLYATRHTFASLALTAGEDIAWLSHVLGHASVAVTLRRYARWLPSERPDAGAKLSAFRRTNQ